VEEALAADADKAMTAGGDGLPVNMDVDIVPMRETGFDLVGADGIVGAQVLHRLIGEDNAPAEGVARIVALEHDDVVPRVAQLHGDGEDEPGGSPAGAGDAHEGSLYMKYLAKQ